MEKDTSKKHKEHQKDDLEDQHNKGHCEQDKKSKKHKKNEKESKKSKRDSQKDYTDKRDKYSKEFFAQGDNVKDKEAKDSKGIKIVKLRKTLQKFLKIYKDDIQDVKGIFASLDEGEEIEIQDIENPKIRKYLEKIFGYLKLRQKTGKLGFRKTDKTDFSLETYMNALINNELLIISEKNNAKNDRKHNHSAQKSSSENNSGLEEDDDEEMEKPQKKHKKNDKSDSEEDQDVNQSYSDSNEGHSQSDQAAVQQNQQSSNDGAVKPRVVGPSLPPPKAQALISQEENQKLIENSTEAGPCIPNKSEVGGWVVGGDLDSFLNDSFKEVESSKVKQFLTTRKVPEKRIRPAELDGSRMAQGSAPLEMESVIQNEDNMMIAQQAYEDKYRSKTLMEIHQEQLAKKKEEQKGKPQERRPFDRNEDLQIKKTDSKKLFAALKDSFQQGPKFLPAQRK